MNFENPLLSGFHPDPSICRVNDDYYLVTSSFEYFPGLPLFHSRDLLHWRQIGHVLDRPSQLPLAGAGPSGGIYAPTIRYHDGVYYVITTNVSGGGNFVVTSTDPFGPWSEPHWIADAEGIDPSLFFDDDGRCWYVGNGAPDQPLYDGHRTLWLQEFDVARMRLIGPKRVVVDGGTDIGRQPIWIEGPHLYKINDMYYLLAAEGGTAEDHSVVVFRSYDVVGPYESYSGNPILTNRDLDPNRAAPITSTGHADLFETQAGEWWMVLLACRPYQPGSENHYNTGRETFLVPMTWLDGWPVTADGSGNLKSTYSVPKLPEHLWPDNYGQGAFVWNDDFDSPHLRADWNMMLTPTEEWHSLSERPDWLRLRLRPFALTSPEQPSFVGIRQRHVEFCAETRLDFHPAAAGDTAGLAVIQNRRGFYALECVDNGAGRILRLVRRDPEPSAEPEIRAQVPIGTGPCSLRIQGQGGIYRFFYSEGGGSWRALGGDEDGTILSTRSAGGFVGAYLGVYAISASPASTGTADFEHFYYMAAPASL